MGLHARIGPLGQLYDAPFQTDLPAPDRFAKVLDFVAGHGFSVYGLSTKTHIHSSHLPYLAQAARDAGIQVHYVAHNHPLDSPTFYGRPNACLAVQRRRAELAQLGGMASFTIVSPLAATCSLEAFEAEVRAVAAVSEVPVRVANGASSLHHLLSFSELFAFCHTTGTEPALQPGTEYLVSGANRAMEDWRPVVAELPTEPLVIYAAYRVKAGITPHLTIYNDDEDAKPPVRPLLAALLAADSRATVLVHGDRPEADALGVLRAQAALEGTEVADVQANLRLSHQHRRVATLAH